MTRSRDTTTVADPTPTPSPSDDLERPATDRVRPDTDGASATRRSRSCRLPRSPSSVSWVQVSDHNDVGAFHRQPGDRAVKTLPAIRSSSRSLLGNAAGVNLAVNGQSTSELPERRARWLDSPSRRTTQTALPADVTTRVSLVTLGCARNEVDSEELAARFEAAGIELVDEPADADAVVVNTCGFVEAAKKDSIDTLLAAADLKGAGGPQAVIAVGAWPSATGLSWPADCPRPTRFWGLTTTPTSPPRFERAGRRAPRGSDPHDRRLLLPLAPADRVSSHRRPQVMAALPDGQAPRRPACHRRRLDSGPMAPVKIASGCDRRCSFCAIPRFRGSFLSRPPRRHRRRSAVAGRRGVSELFLVSENSTSYGKDLGDLRLLGALAAEPCRDRRRRPGAGQLPAAGRDASRTSSM